VRTLTATSWVAGVVQLAIGFANFVPPAKLKYRESDNRNADVAITLAFLFLATTYAAAAFLQAS
jgi:hypothetical protein